MTNMRAKMRVSGVTQFHPSYEILEFSAVGRSGSYPEDGSDENNTYARWTPTGTVKLTVTNPALFGKYEVGKAYYVDFTPAVS